MTQNISPTDIAKLINSVAKIKKKWEDKNSKSINLIQSMAWDSNTREEAHSRILADLLKIPFIKESFMNELLKDFGGFSNCNSYEVKQEEGKVDVQLYSKDKGTIIIIENKINAATEQPNQVARYVKDFAHDRKKVDFKNIFVVYLNPDTHSLPSEQSLTCKDDTKVKVYDCIDFKKQFKVLSYKDDITKWLKEIKNREEAQEEPLLLSALEQYIYYLEVKFKNTDMNREIKNKIDEIFHLDNLLPIEKYNILKEYVSILVPKFQETLEEYKNETATEVINLWYNEILQWIKKENPTVEISGDDIAIKMNCWDDVKFKIKADKNYQYDPYWVFGDELEKDWNHTANWKLNKEKCEKIIKCAKIELDEDHEYKVYDSRILLNSRVPKDIGGAQLLKKVYDAARDLKYID